MSQKLQQDMNPGLAEPRLFAGKTWREIVTALDWPEFREFVLDRDPLQIVNIPWWQEQYQKIRHEIDCN